VDNDHQDISSLAKVQNVIDDLIYFVVRNADGKFEIEGEHLLSDLGNNLPVAGDRITLTIHDIGFSTMEVVNRHFVRHLDPASDTEWIAWVVLVRPIDLPESDDLFDLISENCSRFRRSVPQTKKGGTPN